MRALINCAFHIKSYIEHACYPLVDGRVQIFLCTEWFCHFYGTWLRHGFFDLKVAVDVLDLIHCALSVYFVIAGNVLRLDPETTTIVKVNGLVRAFGRYYLGGVNVFQDNLLIFDF